MLHQAQYKHKIQQDIFLVLSKLVGNTIHPSIVTPSSVVILIKLAPGATPAPAFVERGVPF